MQGIFQKENTDKALKYGIYRHLPTYEKIIRNLVSFFTHQLISVGVNPQIAEVDACRMEHAVSDESFQKLKEHAMREIASQKIDNTFDDFPVKK